MSNGFGLMIESLVAVLLLLTITFCIVLNGRLKKLKADEQALKGTISELITATEIAERAIAGLKMTVRDCDQNLSDRNRLMFRVTSNRNDNHSVDYFGYDNPAVGALFYQKSLSFAFSENYTFSPTMTLDIRVSDASFVRAQGPNDAGQAFTLTSAGFPAYLQNALPPSQREFPTIAIGGYTSFGDRAPLYKNTEVRSAAATLYKIKGSHQIKFGGEFRIDPENRAGVSPTNSATPLSFSAPTSLSSLTSSSA